MWFIPSVSLWYVRGFFFKLYMAEEWQETGWDRTPGRKLLPTAPQISVGCPSSQEMVNVFIFISWFCKFGLMKTENVSKRCQSPPMKLTQIFAFQSLYGYILNYYFVGTTFFEFRSFWRLFELYLTEIDRDTPGRWAFAHTLTKWTNQPHKSPLVAQQMPRKMANGRCLVTSLINQWRQHRFLITMAASWLCIYYFLWL